MWQKFVAYLQYVAKVVWGVGLPILQLALVEIIAELQGSFVDNPIITLALSALGIYFARNGPRPS